MKKSDLFKRLDPPPGGLTRLRARMTEHHRPVWHLLLAAAFAASVVVLGTLTSRELRQPLNLLPEVQNDPEAAVALGLDAPPDEPVVITCGASGLLRLTSANPQVVLYRFATLETEAETAEK